MICNIILLLLLFATFNPNWAMLKSPEEQQVKLLPHFWSFFLQPGGRVEPPTERLEARQMMQPAGSSSQQQQEDEKSDNYYDAVQQEEEQQQGKETKNASDTLNLMAALRVSVDPTSILFLDGAVAGEENKSATATAGGRGGQQKQEPIAIVLPKMKDQGKEGEGFVIDSDTYDDERAELGLADESEAGKGNSTNQQNQQVESIVLLPDAKQFEISGGKSGEISDKERGKDIASEDTFVDGSTGAGGKASKQNAELSMPPEAKIFGIIH